MIIMPQAMMLVILFLSMSMFIFQHYELTTVIMNMVMEIAGLRFICDSIDLL